MADGVAVGVFCFGGERQGIAVGEGFEFSCFFVGREGGARLVEQEMDGFGQFGFFGVAVPVAVFCGVYPDGGVGIGGAAVGVDEAAEVVGVAVCQQDVFDVGDVDTGSGQRFWHLAEFVGFGGEAVGGAAVHQYFFAAAFDEKGVDRGQYAAFVFVGAAVGEEFGHVFGRDVFDVAARQVQRAVKEGGNAQVADLLAVVSGRCVGTGSGQGERQ